MKRILKLLLVLWAAAAVADEYVAVYQLTGAIRCVEGTGIPPEQAADMLRGQGVRVIAAERRTLPQNGADSCGAPTGEANVMKISAPDWSAFLAKHPDAGGYGLWVFDEPTVQIYKYDRTLQCGMGREISLEEMARELEAAGIDVVTSHKGTDGLVHIGVCGASTGTINVYVIDRGSLLAAKRLGYQALVTREMAQRIKPASAKPRHTDMAMPSSPLPTESSNHPDPIPLLW